MRLAHEEDGWTGADVSAELGTDPRLEEVPGLPDDDGRYVAGGNRKGLCFSGLGTATGSLDGLPNRSPSLFGT